ncbi:MAG TPA: alpha/beta hydrolase [Fontimonas sp.]
MSDLSAPGFANATLPWQSDAGSGPTLRGRRTALRQPMLHFVHGNGFCGGVYWPLLGRLLPDYGLFCHDLEGHGASDAPARYSGTAAIIQRVPAVIAEQDLLQPQLVGMGHSFGAAVTLAVAARNPQLFKVLVLLDPILLPPATWALSWLSSRLGRNPMAVATRRRRDRWSSRAECHQRLHNRGIYRNWSEAGFDCFVEYATRDAGSERVLCCPREQEAAIFENPVYPWPLLRHIQCPVLLIHGRDSYPFMRKSVDRVGRRLPQLEAHAVAGGHCFMQEDPAAVEPLIRAFLVRHGLPPATG